jgi:hypothetical protein
MPYASALPLLASLLAAVASAAAILRYDLSSPPARQTVLPRELAEVSGLALDARGRLLAHGDEAAVVHEVDPRTGAIARSWTIGGGGGQASGKKAKKGGKQGGKQGNALRGDFEDIAVVDGAVWLVTSDGMLYETRLEDGSATRHDTGLARACEVEGLAWDAGPRRFVLLCKTPRLAAWRGHVVAVAWDPATRRLDARPRFAVPYASLARVTGAREFGASALARLPDGSGWVMVAGPENVWAEVGPTGQVRRGGRLGPSFHRQAEGLVVLRDGTLLVADEAGNRRPTLSAYSPRR